MPGRSLTPAEIYQQITGGQGPESLGETHKAAKDLSQRLLERADEIARLVDKMRAGWHGASAEGAANSAAPLMAVSGDHSANLTFAQSAADGQISAFQTVKHTVRPIGARPEITAQDVYDLLSGKLGYFAKLDQWQADAQHNVDAYTGYHATTGMNSDRIPARYAELDETGAPIDLTRTSGSPKHPRKGPVGPGGKPPDGHRPGAHHPRAIETPPTVEVPVPKPRTPIPETGSKSPAAHPHKPGPEPSGDRSSASSPKAITAQPDATHVSSSEPGSPALPPGYQFGPSGRAVNPLGSSGFVPLGVPGSGNGDRRGGLGAGNRVGARVPGESVPARGGTAGTPGATGKSGSVVGSGMPGKNKEKDAERTAPPYLRETDPEVFGGSDIKPTPPVIGDRPAR
ncbi:PPE domain-containing protein [Amycolatopsis sp. NPDC054798]